MKIIFTFIYIILFSAYIHAQNTSFGHAANWTYSYHSAQGVSGNGYAHIYHEKDTTIGNESFQLFRTYVRTLLQTGPDPQNDLIEFLNAVVDEWLLRTDNDKVWLHELDGTQHMLLFDFNAGPGDTVFFFENNDSVDLSPYGDCDQLPSYIVIDQGIDTLDGETFPYWDIERITGSGLYYTEERIYRELGVLQGPLYPLVYQCDSSATHHRDHYTFRCFWNDSIHIQSPAWDRDCDWFSSVSIQNELFKNIRFYPNPVKHNRIHIDGINTQTAYQLISMQGQCIQQGNLTASDPTILLSHTYPAGLYLLQLSTPSGDVVFKLQIQE